MNKMNKINQPLTNSGRNLADSGRNLADSGRDSKSHPELVRFKAVILQRNERTD